VTITLTGDVGNAYQTFSETDQDGNTVDGPVNVGPVFEVVLGVQ
jgi:hypothetical protein